MGRARGRGGRRHNIKRKSNRQLVSSLSKKEKKHLIQYGESHPIDDREEKKINYKKVIQKDDIITQPQSESENETEEPEELNSYQQLVASINPQRDKAESSEDEDIDDESDEQEEEEDASEEEDREDEGSDEAADVQQSASADEEGEEENDEDYRDDDVQSDEEEQNEDMSRHSDPFSLHFEKDIDEELVSVLQEKKASNWTTEEMKIPSIGKCHLSYPKDGPKSNLAFKEKDLQRLHVKQSLTKNLPKEKLDEEGTLTTFQHSLFSTINNYQDVYYAERSHNNAEDIRLMYCLHALNHVLKTRSRVIAHNSKIKSRKDDIPDEHRDQGLTRPKVLIVLPFRDAALKVVQTMIQLLFSKDQTYVSNRKRFETEYGYEEDVLKGKKPEDFESTFAGNIDDHFRIGLGIGKKSLKLYTKFYSSDIILASPLGLRTIIGCEGDEERDFDFLSSIEVLIFDQTDVFLMQNWDHITHLLNHLHLQPKDSHGVNFSRVRMWTLNGWSQLYRQTLIFSAVATPAINAVFNKHCHNYCGKIQYQKFSSRGTICQIVTQLPQVFQRFDCASYKHAVDSRFEYFIKKVLPQHEDTVMSQTLIFVPSYFDFVRLRNHFKKQEIDFCQICEYSKDKNISRSRNFFYHGKVHFMLYTERFHFFRRYKIRGIKHVVFYELPLYPHFYSEICNMLQDPKKNSEADNLTCHVMYSKFDAQKLAAVVGTNSAAHMVNSDKSTYMFVTGEQHE